MKRTRSSLIASLFLTVPVWADSSSGHGGMNHAGMNQAGMSHDAMSNAFSQGMVRKVNKAQGKPTR